MTNEEYYRNSYIETSAYNYGTAAPEYIPEERHADVYERPARRIRVGAGYYIFLALATAFVCASVAVCLLMHSKNTAAGKSAEKYSQQLNTLTADNNATEIYLNKSVDMNKIYEIAVNELGMVYPGTDQIIYYERTDTGYVRQYEDIPNT